MFVTLFVPMSMFESVADDVQTFQNSWREWQPATEVTKNALDQKLK